MLSAFVLVFWTDVFVKAEGDPPYPREGVSERELTMDAGPPDRLIAPATGNCGSQGGVKELVYELRTGWIWEQELNNVIFQSLICVGADSKVIETRLVNF